MWSVKWFAEKIESCGLDYLLRIVNVGRGAKKTPMGETIP